MKIFRSILVLSIVALFAFACSKSTSVNTNTTVANAPVVTNTNDNKQSTTVDEKAVARTIYFESCVGCHRENGEGGAGEFEGRKIKVPSFQSKGAMNSSDDRLYDHIANGEENEMPEFKSKLSETQMKSLVQFIRKEFQKK